MSLKDIKDFILDLDCLKNEMTSSVSHDDGKTNVMILERKRRELNTKHEQIQEEVKAELEDFFGYLNMKKASMEVLVNMDAYLKDELIKINKEISSLVASGGLEKNA